MSNTVYPVAAYEGVLTAVVIPLPNGNFSAAILNEDSTEASFPYRYDETDKETAMRGAQRYSAGFYGSLADVRKEPGWGYTMPYPIQKR